MKKYVIFLGTVLALLGTFAIGILSSSAAEIVAARVTTSSGRLNVRSGRGTGYAVVSALEKGTAVTVTDASGDWWQVEYAPGQYGYCSSAYLTRCPTVQATVAADGSRLNLRAGPGTGYAIVGKLDDGVSVAVLSSDGGWAQILHHGSFGYVSEDYLCYPDDHAAVYLSVPRYAQNDPRWARVKLGNSYETVGSAGCTTCVLAMTETVIRGSAVTPDQMVRELTYSSSGVLYWPAAYRAYAGADHLEKVLEQLRRGIPVLIAGFTPAGAQHWVLVTGFTGGDVTAEHFLINDPGTYARTTLADFRAKYSVFYKIMLHT